VVRSRLAMCRGTVLPVLVLIPPLEGAQLWMIVCFFRAIDTKRRLLTKVWLEERETSCVDLRSQ